jgi:sugar phosphate isomerase/epimerase
MPDAPPSPPLGPGSRLGYCTNVHAGHDLETTLANLERYSVEVRRRLGLHSSLGIGLWLSAEAARESRGRSAHVRDRLHELGLRVFTLNGFPSSNFHEPVVKHRVYEPDWADPRRLEYTLDLIQVLHALLGAGEEGSISTLPVGWPGPPCRPVDLDAAAHNLLTVAARLARLEQETGRLIHLDLEPEPGCILQRSAEAVRFWQERLFRGDLQEAVVQRHLRICHDICHSAVVFEDQAEAMRTYQRAGLRIGKVQISSALQLRLEGIEAALRGQAITELAAFQEPRYLHQTTIKLDSTLMPFDDLPPALAALKREMAMRGEFRVHFHVPIHLPVIGLLGTTQEQIGPCLALARELGVRHFEVETYAWTVLPRHLRPSDLAAGIADEIRWLTAQQPPVAPGAGVRP